MNKKKSPRKQSKPLSENDGIDEWYTIDKIDQLNAIASAKRQKILAEFVEQARTTKQVAERLGEPATRLYHHVDALVGQGILVLHRETPKRGTTEKYYRAVARQFRVDENCLTETGFRDENSRVLSEMLDDVRSKMLRSITSAAAGQTLHTTVASAFVNATNQEIEDLSKELVKNLKENCRELKKRNKQKDARRYRVMLLIFPEDD